MQMATVVLTDPVGLHARPAAMLVQAANRFKSEITLTHGPRTANAKSIIMVLSLGARQGAQVQVTTDGEDEDEALNEIVQMLEQDVPQAADTEGAKG